MADGRLSDIYLFVPYRPRVPGVTIYKVLRVCIGLLAWCVARG